MKETQLRQLTHSLLNHTNLRRTLRGIPGIERLERLSDIGVLVGLRLREISTSDIPEDDFLKLGYEARASEGFYPHVKARLIEQGVAERNDIYFNGTFNREKPDEFEQVKMFLHSDSTLVQVKLRVYNTGYKPSE